MKSFILIILLGLVYNLSAQSKQYVFYMNEALKDVSKDQAVVVGKGHKQEDAFVVNFYTIADNKLFLSETYSDSTFSVLDGRRIQYFPNGKVAEYAYYKNSLLHGLHIRKDSLNRTLDSILYSNDNPSYVAMYEYSPAGDKKLKHEFAAGFSKNRPTEKSTVMLANGTKLKYELWKDLLYNNRYAFKDDKASPDTYLMIRYSDAYFDKMVARDPKPKESTFFKTGQAFTISDIDINGNKLKSKDLKGKVLVINYWFINCPPCRKEIPDLNNLVKQYKDSANVKFIGIALDSKNDLKDFLKKMPFDYQIVADGRYSTDKYGVKAFPTHVIVDGDGKVYFHTISSPRQLTYWMSKTINELLEKERMKTNTN